MNRSPLATGRVEALCINGRPVESIEFSLDGPVGDAHAGRHRTLSGHDGEYINTSSLKKGDRVLNWRNWTGLSSEEVREVEQALGVNIPEGCLLENIVVSGVPGFSQLAPTSRLVFPASTTRQLILAVWEENSPCSGVGNRLEQHHGQAGLSKRFIAAAQHKRGVMGFVLAAGSIKPGDTVLVYPPVS